MTDDARRREAAFAAFDAANGRDPNRERVDGRLLPKELVYSRRMTAWLERLYPDASEALSLAARCQHIERWRRPRQDYPDGRQGYLDWRRDLKEDHARRAGEILAEVGYGADHVARVQSLLRKQRLKRDPEAQALEDVVCLVFLAHYLADFAARQEPAKVVGILRKTWAKMSDKGRQAAGELPLTGPSQALVAEALAGAASPAGS